MKVALARALAGLAACAVLPAEAQTPPVEPERITVVGDMCAGEFGILKAEKPELALKCKLLQADVCGGKQQGGWACALVRWELAPPGGQRRLIILPVSHIERNAADPMKSRVHAWEIDEFKSYELDEFFWRKTRCGNFEITKVLGRAENEREKIEAGNSFRIVPRRQSYDFNFDPCR